jgi:WD40 repeat protein
MNILAFGLVLLAPEAPKGSDVKQPAAHSQKQPRSDLYGDALPQGAIARLGTVWMRHGNPITGAVFSSDGKSIIASDFYSGVHVWDAAEGKKVRHFFQNEYCFGLALSPDGRTLAVALGDLSIRLCDPNTGRELGALPKDNDRISQMVFSEDGSLLATGTGRKSVRIWDVATRRLMHQATFAGNVGKVAFSSDGKLIACGTGNGNSLWNLAQGKEFRQLKNDPDGTHSLYAIFAPNGGPMAVWGYEDASIRLFDANGLKEIRRFKKTVQTKSTSPWGWSTDIFASFSPNGKILATFRDVGGIDLWEVDSGKKLHTLACDGSHKPSSLRFSPDSTKLASAGGDPWGGDNVVRVWDVTQGKEILPRAGHGSSISSVAVSPNGNTIATAGRDGVVHLWERSSGKHLFRLEGHPGRRPQVSFSSDGIRVIWWGTYDGDGTLRIWDSRTGEPINRLKLQGPDEFWKGVSDDGKTAFSVDLKGKSVRFHDLATGKITREVADGAYNPPIVLSPAGDQMVCSDGNLRNAADRKELLEIGRIGAPNLSVKFSEDGRRLVAAVVAKGPYDHLDLRSDPPAEEIAVIDPIEGKELQRFGKREEKFYAIDTAALSRDGKMVITAGASGNKPDEQIITLWETETGKERGHFLGHRGQTRALAISADGRFVVSGGDDTSALVWDATRPRPGNSTIRQESAAADLAACVKSLAGENAEQAFASIWALVNAAEKTLSFLRDQNSLFTATDVQKIQSWIQDLDSDKFAARERASKELGLVLDDAEPLLKKALKNEASAEMRQRIDRLIQKRLAGITARELQRLRVLEVLEHIVASSADATRRAAIDLLKEFAARTPETRLTQEAKASLKRLEKQAGP